MLQRYTYDSLGNLLKVDDSDLVLYNDILPIISENDTLKEQVDDYKNRYICQQADIQNMKKRQLKDNETTITQAKIKFLKPFIEQIDNIERIIKLKTNDEVYHAILMIYDSFNSILVDNGVEKISSDDMFDPSLHEAISIINDKNYKNNQIVETYRNGYKLNNMTIQTAQVVVNKL